MLVFTKLIQQSNQSRDFIVDKNDIQGKEKPDNCSDAPVPKFPANRRS